MPIINTDEPTIEQTMVYPEMLQAFEGHLDKEFSSENMSFLRALNDLQIKAGDPNVSDAAIRQQTASIYDHYVKVGSARQVNLPSDQVKAMELQLENLATMNRQQMVDTFTDSRAEVNRLISKDSFPRFIKTKEFRQAAEKVESNLGVEDQIDNLREQAEQARLHPSFGDRFKSAVGMKTKAQELTEQADALQRELDATRALKALDVPQVNTQTVINATTQLANQHREFAARQAEEQEAATRAKALKEGPQPDEGKDVAVHEQAKEVDDLGQDVDDLQEHEWEQPEQELELDQEEHDVAPQLAGRPSVSSGSGTPQVEVGGEDDWPELEEQEVMQRGQSEPQVEEMEVAEMSMEELAAIDLGQGRSRGQRVDSIELGQSRGRSGGVDGAEPPKTSVRESMGQRDSQTKQGPIGPKLK